MPAVAAPARLASTWEGLGASAHVVASSLGHESLSTTVESYAKPEAIAGARQRRVLTVLDGGRLASSP